ncbi:L-gulonolactone oxidase 3 [Euphorbia lathyris]|uniref:L-gulonolactone oxidase 3 n=1 Tax=Euphorbia lathyris TaxID=212925 RepID=UPI003313B383
MFFYLSYLLLLWSAVNAIPPPPVVQCNTTFCTLYNSYGVWNDRKPCDFLNVTYPKTEQDVRFAVAFANKHNLKLQVISRFSHTIPKLACPHSNSFLISTLNYNSAIEIDKPNLAVTVDAGVGLRQLIDKVEEAGLSLVAAPYWEGVTIAGLISTGAHGSSWWGKGGAVHDHVIGISLVVPATESQGFAKIIRVGPKDPLLNAAKVSLGKLGVISKVKLSLEPAFKRIITYNFTNDDHIEDMFIDHGKEYEFGDITWYPSRHTAVYRYDKRVPLDVNGDGVFDFIGFQDNSIVVSQSTRAAEKALEKSRNVNGKCLLANSFVGYKKLVGNGLKKGLIFTGYPVIGYQGKMQTSGSCLYSPAARIDSSCSWDPRINGLLFYESTAIFPASKFGDFIRDLKKLRDLNPDNFCGVDIYNGFLIRFIKASEAYLGQSEDSVVVDFNYYRANDPSTPRLNQDVWEEVEQMAFFKYKAKPHWAKNRNLAFIDVRSKYPNLGKFLEAKKKLDPENMFSSEWSDEILLGKGEVKADGCALEGQCICTEDRHCSPGNGYFCRQGLVFTEAKVCRYSTTPSSASYIY